MTNSKIAALLFNSGTPSADADAITAYTAVLPVSVLRVTCNPGTTSTLKVEETFGGATEVHVLNAGTELTAGNVYTFDVPCIPGASYNIHFGTTQGSAINKLLVQEVEQ